MAARDRIGFALSLIAFGGTLLAANVIYVVFDPAVDEMVATGDNLTSSQASQSGFDWMVLAWDAYPFIALLLAMVLIITAAAVRGGR